MPKSGLPNILDFGCLLFKTLLHIQVSTCMTSELSLVIPTTASHWGKDGNLDISGTVATWDWVRVALVANCLLKCLINLPSNVRTSCLVSSEKCGKMYWLYYLKHHCNMSNTVTIWIPNTWIPDSSEYRVHLNTGPDLKWYYIRMANTQHKNGNYPT